MNQRNLPLNASQKVEGGSTSLYPVAEDNLPKLLTYASNYKGVVRPAGIEPATPGLEGRCSIRLSYGRVIVTDAILHQLVSRTKSLLRFAR